MGIGLGLLVSGLVLKYLTVRIRLHREVTIKLGVRVVKEAQGGPWPRQLVTIFYRRPPRACANLSAKWPLYVKFSIAAPS